MRVTKHVSFLNHNYLPFNFLWIKCFSYLLSTKNDLLKHLETHSGPPETGVKDLVNGEQDANNRCPRCSKKFSYRKSLARHIKESRCRGRGDLPALPAPSTSANTESEIAVDTEETKDLVEKIFKLRRGGRHGYGGIFETGLPIFSLSIWLHTLFQDVQIVRKH